MKITQGFLVGTDQKSAEKIFFIFLQVMERQIPVNPMRINEAVDFTVTVTGDIGQNCIPVRFFIQPVNRHNRKELLNGPGIRQRLKYTEITIINIGKRPVKHFNFRGSILDLFGNFADLRHGGPENPLCKGSFPEGYFTVVEQASEFIPIEQGVIKAFLNIPDTQSGHGFMDITNLGMAILRQAISHLVGPEPGDIKNIEQKHGIVGHQRTAGFRDDVGMGYFLLVKGGHDTFDDIDAVFIQGIIF